MKNNTSTFERLKSYTSEINASEISKNDTSTFARLETSTSELDAAEIEWWEKFADIEERFIWVHTPAIQKVLRANYLRRILEIGSSNARIAELGCGAGWLAILLAQMGAERVVGLDFSDAQIQIARKRALEAGVDHKVTFQVADVPSLSEGSELFDVIILHGFLHHLTTTEIRQVIATAHRMLSPTGRLVVWEPVMYHSSKRSIAQRLLLKLLWILQRLPSRGRRWRVRRLSTEEQQFRTLIAERGVGEPPRGPSPKEMAFAPDELPALMAPYFYVQDRRRCMATTTLIAQETLLMELSYPRIARLVRWPLLTMGRFLERRLLALEPPPSGIWIFEMFECVPN